MGKERRELIADLRERMRQMERAQRPARDKVLATGTPLDGLLPAGGIEAGTLTEWLSDGVGTGTMTLGLLVAGRILQRGGALAVIDVEGQFYPPAAASLGIALEHTVLVRPANMRDALWAWEQALRCGAVGVTLGWLEGLHGRVYRRLQLAAEVGGGVGFLFRPQAYREEPSWAEVKLLVEPRALPRAAEGVVQSSGRRLRIELLHCRSGVGGKAVEVELSDEEAHVRLAPRLADPATTSRAAGA
jgi:protein ImuA